VGLYLFEKTLCNHEIVTKSIKLLKQVQKQSKYSKEVPFDCIHIFPYNCFSEFGLREETRLHKCSILIYRNTNL